MKRVVLECKGRMANQLLCVANAMYVFEQLGITDRLIVVNYPELSRAVFPGNTIVEAVPDVSSLPRVTREQLAEQQGDVVWVWEDVYSNFPSAATMKWYIGKINFPKSFGLPPLIGVHVRHGDYEIVDPANPPAQLPPFIRASNDYFLKTMALCREVEPLCMFYVASDGTDEDLKCLTSQPYVMRGRKDDPLYDLFVLSQCFLIIGSNSTFSHVAAMYGDVPLTTPAMSEAEIQAVIKATL